MEYSRNPFKRWITHNVIKIRWIAEFPSQLWYRMCWVNDWCKVHGHSPWGQTDSHMLYMSLIGCHDELKGSYNEFRSMNLEFKMLYIGGEVFHVNSHAICCEVWMLIYENNYLCLIVMYSPRTRKWCIRDVDNMHMTHVWHSYMFPQHPSYVSLDSATTSLMQLQIIVSTWIWALLDANLII